jgi:hypothetical protein
MARCLCVTKAAQTRSPIQERKTDIRFKAICIVQSIGGRMIACCGLNCSKCEAYIATQENDDTKRARVAKKWSDQYNADIKGEVLDRLRAGA